LFFVFTQTWSNLEIPALLGMLLQNVPTDW